MYHTQHGILAPVPSQARYLFFGLRGNAELKSVLQDLQAQVDGDKTVIGLGQSLIRTLGHEIPGLRTFPAYAQAGVEIPSTPLALWAWLRGDDRGELLHRSRALEKALTPALRLQQVVDAFCYDTGRDLTGYEDGTENPSGEKALETAMVSGQGDGLDGSSFVAVQQWVHDHSRFEAMGRAKQDLSIGRERDSNEEIADAPDSAHVKRTAQEDFEPEAFVLRRSMPWADAQESGLVFVAFGHSLDAFEAQLRRMSGAEDGISDALFHFTRPVTGAYFWCPPVHEGRLDLQAVGL